MRAAPSGWKVTGEAVGAAGPAGPRLEGDAGLAGTVVEPEQGLRRGVVGPAGA